MAYTATDNRQNIRRAGSFLAAIGAPIARGLNGFFAALIRIAENNSRTTRLKALAAMTDEQLAMRGLRRQDLVRHVYGDLFYF